MDDQYPPIEEGQTTQRPNEKPKDKERCTEHNTEN